MPTLHSILQQIFLSAYYTLCNVLGSGHTEVSKTDKKSLPLLRIHASGKRLTTSKINKSSLSNDSFLEKKGEMGWVQFQF